MAHWLKDAITDVSTDCVIFGFKDSCLEVLLYKRAKNPCKGSWALPGGFLKRGELIDQAARRFLELTTGLSDIYLEEVAVFDQIDRYPPWRVFTIGYFALINSQKFKIIPFGSASIEVKWFKVDELPTLAWDHYHIFEVALNKLRDRVLHKPIGFELLQHKFTLPQLQTLYEVILGRKIDKRNFRKKMLKMNLLKKMDEKDSNNKRRPAYLYKFDKHNYNQLVEKGFIFEL